MEVIRGHHHSALDMAPPMSSQAGTTEDAVMNDANVPDTVHKNDQFTLLLRELLSDIHLLDLTSLARVNRLLRGIFMDRSAAEIWRATLTNVGLSPCPDTDIQEPEYAALMFLKECTECGEPAGRHMDPIILVRLCSSCRKYLAVKAETVALALQPLLFRPQFLGTEKQDITLRISSLPPNRYVLKWLPVELINQDKPTEEFQLEFEGKHDYSTEQLAGWRSTIEAALVKALPEIFKPAEAQSSQFNLEVAHTKDATKSSDNLSVDLRALLRADVIFKYDHKPVYYPSSFNSWTIDARTPTFDLASSTVAKAILKELRHPNASYLEMQALGSTFLCGRCASDPKYFTWKGIVSHFVCE
ncbi:unnamed protein product [Rhizoctonia solani]|uniref:F-box domain-containing protein n=1 Tax=Rhizoctonia solani TaxID=456999 RepID=A0A8H3HNN9_9AGAM|nr:unnamed protein product [Rhizoctonia solani]